MQEWTFLAELLKNGYPFLDALSFLGVESKLLQKQLEDGVDITTLVWKQQKGRFFQHLQFFIRISDLANAITCSMNLLHFETGLRKTLMKKTAYPLFILLFAYGMLIFFSSYIIPQMLYSFALDDTLFNLRALMKGIQVLCNVIALLGIISGIGACYLKQHKHLRRLFLLKILPYCQVLRDYNAYIFAGYLCELESQGVSTRTAMSYLKEIRQESVFAHFIQDVIYQLENGIALLDIFETSPLLNEGFRLAFRIGSSTDNLEIRLPAFMKQQEHMWEHKIKKIGIIIQCIAYSLVGIVVFVVYQIMLIPLSMLENM